MIPAATTPEEHDDTEKVTAYQQHLTRVTSKFKMVISSENAELLAGLLDNSGDEHSAA